MVRNVPLTCLVVIVQVSSWCMLHGAFDRNKRIDFRTKRGFVSSLFSVVVCLWSVEGRDPPTE